MLRICKVFNVWIEMQEEMDFSIFERQEKKMRKNLINANAFQLKIEEMEKWANQCDQMQMDQSIEKLASHRLIRYFVIQWHATAAVKCFVYERNLSCCCFIFRSFVRSVFVVFVLRIFHYLFVVFFFSCRCVYMS